MEIDARRAVLRLSQFGTLTEEAIRAAYWRYVRESHPSKGGSKVEFEQAQKAKRELLAELGVRLPVAKRKSKQ